MDLGVINISPCTITRHVSVTVLRRKAIAILGSNGGTSIAARVNATQMRANVTRKSSNGLKRNASASVNWRRHTAVKEKNGIIKSAVVTVTSIQKTIAKRKTFPLTLQLVFVSKLALTH